MLLIVLLLLLLTALGRWEMVRHAHHRNCIPLRIHINGSRGKSSVARLITAGLRAGGISVVGKTTGSAAAILNTDGSETPITRLGGANIKEQLAVFRDAVRQNCQALVIECMAVRPDLQLICEHNIVQATHGVITNIRPDHLEVMGPTLDDVATSLAGTVPRNAHLFTADDKYQGYLSRRAERAHSSYHHCRPDDVTPAEMKHFAYEEFPENVSLALAVCRSVGVDRATALPGMWQVTPDVGAMTRWRYHEEVPGEAARNIDFINGFAANDPESYIRVWQRLDLARHSDQVIVVINLRADRQRRSKDLAPLFGHELTAAHYVLIGEETALFATMIRRGGVPSETIHDLSHLEAPNLWQNLVELSSDGTQIIGVGNIAGIGSQLLEYLRAKETIS